MYHTEPPTDKTIREWYMNSSRVAACALRNEQAVRDHRLCRMRRSRILQSMQHTQDDTKERELLKCIVAVKECIRGGGRHLQDVIFKH